MAREGMKNEPTTEDLAKQIEVLKSDIGTLIETMGDVGRANTARLSESAREQLELARLRGQEAVADVRARAARVESQAEDFVVSQPMTAMGIAAGMGFLLGFLTARR